jgi:small-conductance mechanosensitive channel
LHAGNVLGQSPSSSGGITESAPLSAGDVEAKGYWLTLANRPIFEFCGTLDGYSPEERRAAAQVRLHSVLAGAKTVLVTTQALEGGIQILLDSKPIFVVAKDDLLTIRGETLESSANKAAEQLRQAIYDSHILNSKEEILKAFGSAAMWTLGLGLLIWLARAFVDWLQIRFTRLAAVKTEKVKSRELRRVGLKSFVSVLRMASSLVFWFFCAFISYTWLIQVMRCFPYFRPWGEYLNVHIVDAELGFARSVLTAVPGLVVVLLIFLIARLMVQVITNLFSAVEEGDIVTSWLDSHTASTTRRLFIFAVWVMAVVVAYPYIPGSGSLAFKGMTVFAGLIFSLGSTSLVSQIASGMVLIYSRAFRSGDYVRFGDIEGTVLRIGITSTYIQTIKNEEMHIANNVMLSSAVKNYSRFAQTEGVFLSAKVTISYATPWRQIEAMLFEAARRTTGLLPEPKPFVLQTALSDFYAEYELNVRLAVPSDRVFALGRLHANIQDVFNENDVQIMSPHYLADPPKPHVVPKERWHLPPAPPEDPK